MPLQLRRGPTADRLSITPLAGELVYDTTTGAVYVGNGSTAGGLPVTNFSVDDARLTTARLFLGESLTDNSIHSGVTFQYVANRLITTIENIDLDGTVRSNITPEQDGTFDLGSPTNRWRDIYLNGSSIYLGEALLTANTDGSINLPPGTTVGGFPIGLEVGQTYEINIIGSIFSNDSGTILDGVTGAITASEITANNFYGTVRGGVVGSVFAENSTLLVDAIGGFIPGEVIQGEITAGVTGSFTGEITGTGNATFVNVSISGSLSVTPTTGDAPVFIKDVSPSDAVTDVVANFRLTANSTFVDSGPEIQFQVNTTGNPTPSNIAKISSKVIQDEGETFLPGYGELTLQVFNGSSYVNQMRASENTVIFNEKITLYKNALTTYVVESLVSPTMETYGIEDLEGTDINIVPADGAKTKIYSDLVPGDRTDSSEIPYNLGDESNAWKNVYVSNHIIFDPGRTPAASVGAAGDVAGMFTCDGSYYYFCTANYDGLSNIWVRLAVGATW